ncbi:MAG: hypothetical protein ACK454_02960 [Flavobacteriales bacterium]|jgi:hypothetical protein
MKLNLIVILLIHCGISNAQKANGIQFLVNPYMQDFGNLEKRYTTVDCETVFSKHKKYPTYEFGILYHHDFNSKWGWGVGSTYKFAKFNSEYKFTVYQQPDHVMYEYKTTSSVYYANVKFQASYHLTKRLFINTFVNFELPLVENINSTPDYGIQFNVTNHYITPEGMVSEPIQSNKIDIDHSGYDTHLNITPEMNLQYEVYKGLRICAGFRYKFWRSKYPILKVQVDGFTGPENYNNQGITYLSEVNNKDFSISFGLVYEISRAKKEK